MTVDGRWLSKQSSFLLYCFLFFLPHDIYEKMEKGVSRVPVKLVIMSSVQIWRASSAALITKSLAGSAVALGDGCSGRCSRVSIAAPDWSPLGRWKEPRSPLCHSAPPLPQIGCGRISCSSILRNRSKKSRINPTVQRFPTPSTPKELLDEWGSAEGRRGAGGSDWLTLKRERKVATWCRWVQ